MVIGAGDLDDAAGRIWDALRYARDQPAPPTPEQVEDLVECLAGRMLPQTDLVAAVAEHEHTCDLLTARQAKVLDVIRLLPRVEVRGGAGSGKTWLAVERARRLAADGQRVGLVCYSRGLATYLRRRVAQLKPGERPAYVGTFHGLGVDWLGAPAGVRRRQRLLGAGPAAGHGRARRATTRGGTVRRVRGGRGAGLRRRVVAGAARRAARPRAAAG